MSVAERAGHTIAECLGEGPSPKRIAAQRAALAALEARPLRSTWRIALPRVAMAVVAVALLVVGSWQLTRSKAPLAIVPVATLSDGRIVAEGTWLHAEKNRQVRVAFSEGSSVVVESDSRARLLELSAGDARVALESGLLTSSIRPQTGVAWTLQAGPYRLRVLGTRFTLQWDPSSGRLLVRVQRGAVNVSGGVIREPGLVVHEGHRLETDYQFGNARLGKDSGRPAASNDGPGGVGVSPSTRPAADASGVAGPAEPAKSRRAVPPRALGWKQLAEVGDYAKAVEAAEREGFSKLVQDVPAGDLLQLADAARLSGKAVRAREALLGLRQRFPSHHTAQLAAFGLGRLANDVTRNDAEAIRWFRIFLAESNPRSDLSEGARSRLMNALVRTGDLKGAKRVAEQYLEYHPRGSHRKVALSLVSPPNLQ